LKNSLSKGCKKSVLYSRRGFPFYTPHHLMGGNNELWRFLQIWFYNNNMVVSQNTTSLPPKGKIFTKLIIMKFLKILT